MISSVGLHDRSYRGVIEITGRDRADWLHNLTTNVVAGLAVGSARYTFACSVKGRVIFDAHVLILPEAILLDLDRRYVATALQHLDKHLIAEDVALTDRSGEFVRLALTGMGGHPLMGQTHGGPDLAVQEATVAGVRAWTLRSDFCGLPGVEVFVPVGSEAAVWSALHHDGATPVGLEAVQLRRIEAGLPWLGDDLDEQVLPAETGQLARAVSFNKGCYLGQEVVERMRARGALARRLVGLRARPSVQLGPKAILELNGKTVGRVTSACVSPTLGCSIALGYVQVAHADPGTTLNAVWDGGRCEVLAAALPFVAFP